ncbi:Spherulation-specific family 4-domain-containing protein [Mycena floridula]|nr:Spherulation-specific family 4-domain-containing protein [Mycena floridula]
MFWRPRIFLALLCLPMSSTMALLPSGVIFPLFFDPGENCTAWASLNNAVSANPALPFIFVINPNNGPGVAVNSQPDVLYQACIPQLVNSGTAQHNVRILGYVATHFGSGNSSDVLNNITTYANWGAEYRPKGIYFDQTNPITSLLSVYESFISVAHHSFGPDSFIALNPSGNPSDSGYFMVVDLIITVTDFYSAFNISQLVISPSSPAARQAVVLHDDQTATNSTLVEQLIVQARVGYIFITNTPEDGLYKTIPADWLGLCSNISSAAALVVGSLTELPYSPSSTMSQKEGPSSNSTSSKTPIIIGCSIGGIVIFAVFILILTSRRRRLQLVDATPISYRPRYPMELIWLRTPVMAQPIPQQGVIHITEL